MCPATRPRRTRAVPAPARDGVRGDVAPSVCFLVCEELRMDPRVSGKQPWGAANLPRPMPPSRLLALYLCWGASVPAMKVMVETIPPLAGAAVVFLAGAGIVGMLAGGRRGATGPQLRRAALTGL